MGSMQSDFCAYWEANDKNICTIPLEDSTLFLTEVGLSFSLEGDKRAFRLSKPEKFPRLLAAAIPDDAVLTSLAAYSFGVKCSA